MQESNFEKQVQQKLDELRLTPSEPVWQNIEVAIRKKKERRLVYWLLPFFLLAGGLAWWQKATWHSENVAQQPVPKTLPQAPPTFSNPHTDQQVQHTTTSTNGKSATQTPTRLHTQLQEPNKTDVFAGKDVIQEPAAKQEHFQHQLVKEKRETVLREPFKTKKSNERKQAVSSAPDNATKRSTAETNLPSQNNIAGIQKNAEPKQDSLHREGKTDTAAKSVPKRLKNTQAARRLQWGIVGRIGVSNAVASLPSGLSLNRNVGVNPAADFSSGVPGYGQSASAAYRQPVAPTYGMQFSIGAVLKKRSGKSSFITGGLQYSYYSYHLAVGTQLTFNSLIIQSAITPQKTFLNNGKQNPFTNTFHVIEMPIGYEYQLLKNLPLHVQHGVTLSQVVSSKVLQYDYSSNTYYQRSAGMRKTGVNIFTSVAYTIRSGKAYSLQAGPQLQYGLQPLFKNTANSHLLSGGLAIAMGF